LSKERHDAILLTSSDPGHEERSVTGRTGKHVANRSAAFLCFCAATVLPLPLNISQLPRDEYEASVMIRDGQLDSLDWEQLRVFYVQPLNVPSGDLRYLKELTDLRVSDLPVTSSRLAPYEPWSPGDIRRFYTDFPQLAPFAPILSFVTSPVRHCSEVSLNIQADQALRPTALSRFAASVDPRLTIIGSAYHRDSAMQWRTRAIDFRLAGVARFEAGNFDAATDGGLFFGYFPDDKENQTTASNWLYGRSRTWNGVYAVSDCWDKFQVSTMYHTRTTENVQQIACKADVGNATDVVFGASRMEQTRLPLGPALNNSYYIHCGLGGQLAGFHLLTYAGVDAAHPWAVPISCQISRKSNNVFVKFLVARIPGDLRLPLSSIAYLCRRDLGAATQDSSFEDRTLLECRTAFRGSAGLETSMDLCSVIHGRDTDVQATVSAQGRSVVDYRVEYGCLATTDRPRMVHNVNLLLHRALHAHLAALFSCRYFYKDNGFQSVFLRVPLDISIIPAITMTPFITVNSNTDGERAASVGLKQTLHCFDKTWCDWAGQISRDERNIQEWDVSVRTNFLF
jgi:hypothetical protein